MSLLSSVGHINVFSLVLLISLMRSIPVVPVSCLLRCCRIVNAFSCLRCTLTNVANTSFQANPVGLNCNIFALSPKSLYLLSFYCKLCPRKLLCLLLFCIDDLISCFHICSPLSLYFLRFSKTLLLLCL